MKNKIIKHIRKITVMVMVAGILFTAGGMVNYDNAIMPCGAVDTFIEIIS